MGEHRREIRHSADFLAVAKSHFPPGGSISGRPSFERFSAGPLAAADDLFSIDFENQFEIVPGIRSWITLHTPHFPPIVFYAVLVEGYVELVSLTVDEDYWELLDGDPEM